MNGRHLAAAGAAAAYTGTVAATNVTTSTFGVITVAGLSAPAGVLLAGAVFGLRDLVDEWAGRPAVLVAMAAGTAVSAAVASPALALASAVAFAVSELVDLAVYWPLRSRGRMLAAVAASNAAGLVVDSVLFLALAFGGLHLLPGQVAGKAFMTVLAVGVLAAVRLRRERGLP
ncbi:VUT family protein [Longispora sp. NPDC051575]|uniref:VUT family protein n=1 Tax=Longispora sp. NPDC051575 TaxID=3154943 RepID=UPI00343CA8D6